MALTGEEQGPRYKLLHGSDMPTICYCFLSRKETDMANWQDRALIAEAEVDRIRMRIDCIKADAYAAWNPANYQTPESQAQMHDIWEHTLAKIGGASIDDPDDKWIDKFFVERTQLKARVAHVEDQLQKEAALNKEILVKLILPPVLLPKPSRGADNK